MKVIAVIGEYKGSKTISIFEKDDEDGSIPQYPVISFGLKKAKAIIACLDDIKAFVTNNEKEKKE